jgi:hypothetical protein
MKYIGLYRFKATGSIRCFTQNDYRHPHFFAGLKCFSTIPYSIGLEYLKKVIGVNPKRSFANRNNSCFLAFKLVGMSSWKNMI